MKLIIRVNVNLVGQERDARKVRYEEGHIYGKEGNVSFPFWLISDATFLGAVR